MKRILLVRVGALGDTLMVTPALRALKSRSPNTEIDFLCSESAAPLLELNPHIARLYRIRLRNLPYALSVEKQRLARQLRSRNYDAAYLLETAPRYHRLLERAKLPRISGFAETAFDPRQHCIANYLRAVGISEWLPEEERMELPIAAADESAAERLIGHLANPRIGLQLGYGPRGKKADQSARLKGWGRDNFLRLSRMLLDHGANLIFTGSAEDQADIASILQHLPKDRTLAAAGRTTVREMAALLRKLDLFISVDTGPAHMAAALAVPLIVLWGPAIYEQVRPLSPVSPVRILRIPPQCAPCYGTERKKTCKRNVCMENITAGLVLQAAQDFLPDLIRR